MRKASATSRTPITQTRLIARSPGKRREMIPRIAAHPAPPVSMELAVQDTSAILGVGQG